MSFFPSIATIEANLQLAGVSAGAAGAIGTGISGLGTIANVGLVIALLKVALGPYRMAPDNKLTIGGLPGVKQLSGIGALKMAIAIFASVNIFKAAAEFIKKVADEFHSHADPASSTGVSANTTSADVTKFNPVSDALSNSIGALQVFSTATNTATLYLAGNTGTSVGNLWWTTKPSLASTATGSYQSIFYSTKLFTDGLCGVTTGDGVMPIEQILDAIANGPKEGLTTTATSSIIIPSLETFANTLYNPVYINSATTTLVTLITLANTSTTTQSQLQTAITQFNTATQALSAALTRDITNQTNYVIQTSNVSTLMQSVQIYNNIQNNHSVEVVNFYKSTLNPAMVDTIDGMSTLQDLTSVNTETVYAALAKIGVANTVVPSK